MQTLSIGISTCPNDTFIYEALATGVQESPVQLRFEYHDVQTLNEKVRAGELDVAKVSCGVLPEVLGDYALLRSGGAMGYGCGPLLLSAQGAQFSAQTPTVLPGRDTTAALLFRFWCEQGGWTQPQVEYALFDALYRQLREQRSAQGVVIHEHRFTWQRDGLHLLADLGDFWEQQLHAPIPLGCAVIRRSLGPERAAQVDAAIRASLQHAWQRPQPITPYIRKLAQIADEEVILAHIRTFVTEYSLDLGTAGEKALETLFAVWRRTHGEGQFFPHGQ